MSERILLLSDEFSRLHCLTDQVMHDLSLLGHVTHLPSDAATEEIHRELTRSTALFVAGWERPQIWLDAEALDRAPLLSIVLCGQDNRWRFMDVRTAMERGVICCDSSGAMGRLVAEFTVGALLACLRDIPAMHRLVADGGWWDGWQDQDSRFPHSLNNRVTGLLGMGEIGKSLARMLNPFGCRLLARSSYLDPAAAAELGVELTTTEDLCERSDILIVATQPRADTAGILTAECVDRLRRGSIVVLVGRASTVDIPALYRRVLCGDLRLAIDVYEEEPLPAGHPLRGHPGVLHTPHIAGRTVEANRLMIEELVADLTAIRAGQPGTWTTTETRVVATAQAVRA